MKSRAGSWRAENWADVLPGALGLAQLPVDLHAVARHRRVKRLGFRLMVPRGVLLPVGGGFEVYLLSLSPMDLDISKPEPEGLLSSRQRFSLAHEIAHTYFFKFSATVPAPHEAIPNVPEIETICDRTAGYILVPTDLLKKEIVIALGDRQRINAGFVRLAANRFRTSPEVLIDRLSVVEPANPFARCILLVRNAHGNAVISAIYFGIGLLNILPRPTKYTPLTEWLPRLRRDIIESPGDSEWTTNGPVRTIIFTKTAYGNRGDFLLQVTANPAGGPSNRPTEQAK